MGGGKRMGEKDEGVRVGNVPWEGSPRPPGWRQEHLVQLRGRWERPDLASALAGERGSGGRGLRSPAGGFSPRDAVTVPVVLGPAVFPPAMPDQGRLDAGGLELAFVTHLLGFPEPKRCF